MSLSGNGGMCRAWGARWRLVGGSRRCTRIHRLNHRDIPFEWLLQRCQLHLLKQDHRSEHKAAMETKRNQPSGLVCPACAQSIMIPGLRHNRITSRLTC